MNKKWVTFYWSINNGISDLTEHKNKEIAKQYFLTNCNKYFSINTNLTNKFKTPMSYGYQHRKFYIMTKYMFEKYFK